MAEVKYAIVNFQPTAKRVKTAAVSDNASEGSTEQGGDNGNGTTPDPNEGGENEE